MVVVNTHSKALNKTLRAIDFLVTVLQADYAHTQLGTLLMNDMLRDIGSSVDSLAMGRISPYLVPVSLVQDLLKSATKDRSGHPTFSPPGIHTGQRHTHIC